jgi:transposase, IS5 family
LVFLTPSRIPVQYDYFKERMAETGKDKVVWAELQRQLDALGLQVKRGTIQDATFIEADHRSSNQRNRVARKLRLAAAEMVPGRKREPRLISAISCIKKTDIDYCLIREIETATAKLHDIQVDLSVNGEVVLRDRGYFGVPAKGYDFTTKRRTTEYPLGELDKKRNRLISKLRSPGERPHAVIKRVFGAGRVLVTTVRRVYVKMTITAFAFNLYQLCTLKNAGIIQV